MNDNPRKYHLNIQPAFSNIRTFPDIKMLYFGLSFILYIFQLSEKNGF